MKYTLRLVAPLALALLAVPSHANELSVSVSVDTLSEYVFRGVTLAGTAVQPGTELSYGGWTVGAWGSFAVGAQSPAFDDEIDLYGRYAFAVSDTVSADVGATLYHYPQYGGVLDIGTDDGDASTLEVFGALQFDTALAPAVTAFYDVTLKAFTLQGDARYSVALEADTSLDFGATVGAVSVEGNGDYQYGQVSAALRYGFNETSSAYIGLNGGLSSEDTFSDIKFDPNDVTTIENPKDSSVWFGVGISSGF